MKEYDIVCVGFGHKGLALATALADQKTKASVLFLEREGYFDSDLKYAAPGNIGASPFLRDLITQQNPRSQYTFISFLHEHQLLAGFTNTSQMTTFRALTSRYMRWVATQIEALGWVAFGKEVIQVRPLTADRGSVTGWSVDTRDASTGVVSRLLTKRLVVATGRSQTLPRPFTTSEIQSRVLQVNDSSQLMQRIYRSTKPVHIAIVGANQESVELFQLLQKLPGEHRVTMFITGSALRVDDQTPFTQALIDGADSQLSYLPPAARKKIVSTKVSLENPTVDLHTLEQIYIANFVEKVKELDGGLPRFSITTHQAITDARVSEGRVVFRTENTRDGSLTWRQDTFDIVMAASEQGALTATSILSPLASLFDSNELNIDIDYQVNFRKRRLAADCGIWLLGSLLDRHQRRDDFTVLATSAHRALDSLKRSLSAEAVSANDEKELAVL